jgi:hypothetical protein
MSADMEAIARIIEPEAWDAYDRSIAPYKENRGARANDGEAFWYQITWTLGCRSIEDVHRFWVEQPIPAPPLDMYLWAQSQIKAHKILIDEASK